MSGLIGTLHTGELVEGIHFNANCKVQIEKCKVKKDRDRDRDEESFDFYILQFSFCNSYLRCLIFLKRLNVKLTRLQKLDPLNGCICAGEGGEVGNLIIEGIAADVIRIGM